MAAPTKFGLHSNGTRGESVPSRSSGVRCRSSFQEAAGEVRSEVSQPGLEPSRVDQVRGELVRKRFGIRDGKHLTRWARSAQRMRVFADPIWEVNGFSVEKPPRAFRYPWSIVPCLRKMCVCVERTTLPPFSEETSPRRGRARRPPDSRRDGGATCALAT